MASLENSTKYLGRNSANYTKLKGKLEEMWLFSIYGSSITQTLKQKNFKRKESCRPIPLMNTGVYKNRLTVYSCIMYLLIILSFSCLHYLSFHTNNCKPAFAHPCINGKIVYTILATQIQQYVTKKPSTYTSGFYTRDARLVWS